MKYCITYYVHEDSSLPKKGWIQSCIMCYTFTSRTIFYSQIEKRNTIIETQVYLCPSCKQVLTSKIRTIEHGKKIEKFKKMYNVRVQNKVKDFKLPELPKSHNHSNNSNTSNKSNTSNNSNSLNKISYDTSSSYSGLTSLTSSTSSLFSSDNSFTS